MWRSSRELSASEMFSCGCLSLTDLSFAGFPSLPQAMYERLFCWIVGRINDIIEVKNYDARVHGKNTVIGVLDIYGFEIFQNNRFASA